MATQQLMIGMIRFFHDLFTVIWVGGLAFMVLTLIPSLKKALGKNQQAQILINAITRRHRVWVYISIAGLFITGLLLGKQNNDYTGFMHFGNIYSSLTAIKHIFTFLMLIIALFRSILFGKKDIVLSPGKNKFNMLLIIINFFFGFLILLLSGFIASI